MSLIAATFVNMFGVISIPLKYLIIYAGICFLFSIIVALIDYNNKGKQALIYGIIAAILIAIIVMYTNSKIESTRGDAEQGKLK